jgi:hypothetical protein
MYIVGHFYYGFLTLYLCAKLLGRMIPDSEQLEVSVWGAVVRYLQVQNIRSYPKASELALEPTQTNI